MKITEIRNKLFGLSDLKCLIRENAFDEAGRAGGNSTSFDWAGYFNSNPERIKLTFVQAMGLQRAPKEPLTIEQFEAMGGGESEIRKFFGDDKFAEILSNPINFVKDHGAVNSYAKAISRARKLMAPKITGEQTLDILKKMFIENGGGSITTGNGKLTYEYFDKVRFVTEKVIAQAFNSGFKEFNDVYVDETGEKKPVEVGNVYDPFSLFLYFYFVVYYCKRSGLPNFVYEKRDAYNNNILAKYPEFAKIIEWEKGQMSGGSENSEAGGGNIISFIQKVFLNQLGVSFMSNMTPEIALKIYENGNLYSVLVGYCANLGTQIKEADVEEYPNTVGGFILSLLYLFTLSSNNIADDVKAEFEKYLPDNDFSLLRGSVYRARYITLFNKNKGNGIMSKFIETVLNAYGAEAIDLIFDPFITPSIVEVRNAVIKAKAEGLSFDEFSSIEIPGFDNNESLTLFESFVLFTRQAKELLSDAVVKYYGGIGVLNEETLFSPAGEGLKLLHSLDKKPDSLKKRYQRLENLYSSENSPEDWSFYDLLATDHFSKDKTQRAIFYFLMSNTKPGTAKWSYEYNRYTQHDQALNPKSIDILCEYGGKTAAFEYQGELHFRPKGVSPNDEVEDAENSPSIAIFNEMRNAILNQYIEAHNKRAKEDPDFGKKWETSEIYIPIMRSVYESKYTELAGVTFEESYANEMRSLNSVLTESKKERTKSRYDIIIYIFCVLCHLYGRELPEAFKKFDIGDDIFKRPSLTTDAIFLASPARFKEDIHVYYTKISDEDKAELIKSRGWAAIYILPPVGRVSADDVAFTRGLANPSNAVFEWKENEKKNILEFAKSIGIQVEEKEVVNESALFEEIIRELLKEYNPQ